MKLTLTKRALRNYAIFLTICLLLGLLGVYVYLIPAFHLDFVTAAALHPLIDNPDKPIKDVTAGITAEPLKINVMRQGKALKLSGVIWKKPGSKKIMLYSHGNAADIDNRFNNFRIACALNEGYSVLIYDYEGYGRSEGKLGYERLIEDAKAAYKYVRALGYAPNDIVLYGESLGGGVSTELARTEPVRAILIDCSFTSPEGWVKSKTPVAKIYPKFLFPSPHYDNLEFLEHQHPLALVVAAGHDQSIPASHFEELKAKAIPETMFLFMPDSLHCIPAKTDEPAFAKAMKEFCERIKD